MYVFRTHLSLHVDIFQATIDQTFTLEASGNGQGVLEVSVYLGFSRKFHHSYRHSELCWQYLHCMNALIMLGKAIARLVKLQHASGTFPFAQVVTYYNQLPDVHEKESCSAFMLDVTVKKSQDSRPRLHLQPVPLQTPSYS